MLYCKHYVSSTVACGNTSTECMYVVIQITTSQDEVTHTHTQWCSCGGVSVNECMEDCLIPLHHLYMPFVYKC